MPPFPQHLSLRIQLNPRQREAPPACLPASPPSQNRPRLPDSLALSFSTELSAALSCNTFSQLGTKKSKYLFFAQKLPFSTVAKIPPQNRKNRHSHTKHQYLLSWHHHGQKLAGERGGRPQCSHLQELTEGSPGPPAGAQSPLNSARQGDGEGWRRGTI